MDTSRPINCDESRSVQQDHSKDKHHPDLQKDMASAKLAWEAWKSDDPKQWDKALEEKNRLMKTDPKAWRMAMNDIDAQEELQRELKREEQERQALAAKQAAEEAARQAASRGSDGGAQNPASVIEPPAAKAEVGSENPTGQGQVAQLADEVVVAPNPVQPGYAPDSPFAPPPPTSPAYDAAYNRPPAKFYGLNLGILKLGVNSHGSLDVGVNVGIVRGEVQAGLENRVDGEFMPFGGPLHARAGAGVGVNKDGFHGEAGAGANFFNLVNGDADVGARLGRDIGVDADARGRALFVNGQGEGGVSLGEQGLNAYGGANADLAKTLGARGGGRFGLGPQDSGLAVGGGLKAGDRSLDLGPSIDAYPNGEVNSAFHLDPGKDVVAPFYPMGDRNVDSR